MGIFLAGFHECFMHGLYGGQVLVDNGLQCAFPLLDIADDTPENTHICVSIYKYTDIHFITQLLICKDQDAFHNDDFSRVDGDRLFAAVMNGVVINGAFHRLAGLQLAKMLDH